jgi:hypothetical protein
MPPRSAQGKEAPGGDLGLPSAPICPGCGRRFKPTRRKHALCSRCRVPRARRLSRGRGRMRALRLVARERARPEAFGDRSAV